MSINIIEKQTDNNPIGTTVELASSASVVGDYVKADGKAKDATLFPALSNAVEGGVNLGKKRDVIDFLFGKIRRAASFDDRSYFISSTGIFQSVSGKITPIIEFDTECLFGHIHLNEGYLFASNGTTGKLYYKTANADDFTVVDLPETNVQQSVCRDTTNNRFVAISKTSIYTSTDLLTWTKQKDLTTQYGSYNRGIVELGGDFYTDYNSYSGTINKIPGDFVTAESAITVSGYYSALVKHKGQVFFTADAGSATAYIYYTNDFVTINSLSFAKNTYPGAENMATGAPAFDSVGNVIAVYGDVFYAYDLVNGVTLKTLTIQSNDSTNKNTVVLIGGDGTQSDIASGCVTINFNNRKHIAISFYYDEVSDFRIIGYFSNVVEHGDYLIFFGISFPFNYVNNCITLCKYNKKTKELSSMAIAILGVSSNLSAPFIYNKSGDIYISVIHDATRGEYHYTKYDFKTLKKIDYVSTTAGASTTYYQIRAHETSKYVYFTKGGNLQFIDKNDDTFPPPDRGVNLQSVEQVLIDELENVYAHGYNPTTTTTDFYRLIGSDKSRMTTPLYSTDGGSSFASINNSFLTMYKGNFHYFHSSGVNFCKGRNNSMLYYLETDSGHYISISPETTLFIPTSKILFFVDNNKILLSEDGETFYEFAEISYYSNQNAYQICTDIVETTEGLFVFQTGVEESCILESGGDGEFYPPRIKASRPNHNVYIKAK